jgi:hypothetical protein
MKCKDCQCLGRFIEDDEISSGFKAHCLDPESSNFGLGIGSNMWDRDWCKSNSTQDNEAKNELFHGKK